jgi:hypothetical protein
MTITCCANKFQRADELSPADNHVSCCEPSMVTGPEVSNCYRLHDRRKRPGTARRHAQLQIRIELVLGVTSTIVIERIDLVAEMRAHRVPGLLAVADAPFVNVIAVVKDRVEIRRFA